MRGFSFANLANQPHLSRHVAHQTLAAAPDSRMAQTEEPETEMIPVTTLGNPPPSGNPPPKVMAAMEFLRFGHQIQTGESYEMGGSAVPGGRGLTKPEADVYDSALTVMLEYFNMEGFDVPYGQPQHGDDAESQVSVQV